MAMSKVAVALNPSRELGCRRVVDVLGMPDLNDKKVLVKPNFNTADRPPGSTHIDTIRTMMELILAQKPREVTLADRSGPAKTSYVFREKGMFELSAQMGFTCLLLDEMPKERYVKIVPPGSHWRNGFFFARPALEADAVIDLCCLKTHQYGGHFTMSLKLATGMVHRSNMTELHTSLINQRNMIAEMNYPYRPALAVMDGVDAFYSGGPMSGNLWNANLTFASTDRIALDAVGVAALKMHGTTRKVESRPIFEQDQIRRAVELGLGASSPDEIDIIPADEQSNDVARELRLILDKG